MDKLSLRQRIAKKLGELVTSYHRMRGCQIGPNTRISKSALIDRANPRGVHIGANSRVLIGAWVLAHDYSRGALEGHSMWLDTYIGSNTVIGGRSMIMPGVHVGDHVYVGAGSIVTHDLPDHCIAAGNPARVVRTGTVISDRGQIVQLGSKVERNKLGG